MLSTHCPDWARPLCTNPSTSLCHLHQWHDSIIDGRRRVWWTASNSNKPWLTKLTSCPATYCLLAPSPLQGVTLRPHPRPLTRALYAQTGPPARPQCPFSLLSIKLRRSLSYFYATTTIASLRKWAKYSWTLFQFPSWRLFLFPVPLQRSLRFNQDLAE